MSALDSFLNTIEPDCVSQGRNQEISLERRLGLKVLAAHTQGHEPGFPNPHKGDTSAHACDLSFGEGEMGKPLGLSD